jgi:CheY-like chemotaxis protein
MAKPEKRKILVVDDEADFNELVKMRFEAGGYDVITASSGEDALELVKTGKLDAVLLDIMMPGMDGLAVLKRIREEHPKLPVFMVTAFSNEERVRLAAKLNASGFIVKSRQDLSDEIKNISDAIDTAKKYRDQRG